MHRTLYWFDAVASVLTMGTNDCIWMGRITRCESVAMLVARWEPRWGTQLQRALRCFASSVGDVILPIDRRIGANKHNLCN
jgi:hypothetical protein